MNKKQQAQYDGYVKKLDIKHPAEHFVLKHILWRDWNRQIIILDIEQIKVENGLVTVKCRTRSSSYWFSVSDCYKKEGWIEGIDQYGKESYVTGDLYHKLRY